MFISLSYSEGEPHSLFSSFLLIMKSFPQGQGANKAKKREKFGKNP